MKTKALSIAIVIALMLIGSVSASAQEQNGYYRDYKKNDKGQPTEVITYRSDSEEHLTPVKKTTYVYEGDNVSVKTVYAWDVFKNIWVEQSTINFTHGANNQKLSATEQKWDDKTSNWSQTKEYMFYETDSAAILLTGK